MPLAADGSSPTDRCTGNVVPSRRCAGHFAPDADDLLLAGLEIPLDVPACSSWYGDGISMLTFRPSASCSV